MLTFSWSVACGAKRFEYVMSKTCFLPLRSRDIENRIFSDKNTTDITNMTAEMICTIKYQKSKGTSCSDQYKFKDKQISVYENNLDAIISLASIDGIKIVLSTQPSLLWGKPNKINAEKKILSISLTS